MGGVCEWGAHGARENKQAFVYELSLTRTLLDGCVAYMHGRSVLSSSIFKEVVKNGIIYEKQTYKRYD